MLAARFPAFAEAHDEMRTLLEARLDGPLTANPDAALFALHFALYRLLGAFEVSPAIVAGSGVGEIAAACAAGVLSPDDAGALAVAATSAGPEGLRATAARLGYAKPGLTIVSPVTPDDPGHWASGDFLRTATADLLSRVRSAGATTCLVLDPRALSTPEAVFTLLARAYTAGAAVSWQAAFTGSGAVRIDLPGYPFQRTRHWLDSETSPGPSDAQDLTRPEADEPWDADELSRLAVEEPQAARQALTALLFARVTAMTEPAQDPEGLHARFADSRLGDLGLDSLRAMRLRDRFRTELLVDVPPQRLLGDTTVADIVDLVCRSLVARSLVVSGGEEPEPVGPVEEFIL
jgi:acyl transferase domain-containing protein